MRSVVLIIANLAVISAFFWFFDVSYREYRIDLLRERLSVARDSLFAAARDGVISVNDPAYRMTRQIIDGMIGFADQVGVWQMLVMQMTRRFWEVPEEREEFLLRFANARSALTSNSGKVIDDALICVHRSLLAHMVHTSLCLAPFAVVWSLAFKAFGAKTTGKFESYTHDRKRLFNMTSIFFHFFKSDITPWGVRPGLL